MGKEGGTRLEDMIVFARVVERRSLSRAATDLGTTRSAVSKAIARLEARVGARLLQRTTRELSVTAAGRACVVHCARLAQEATMAERAARELVSAPQGKLRVSCALSLGLLLAPRIPRFSTRYPGVELELGLTESVVDLVREGVDVGVRLGRLQDSSLVAKKIADYDRVVCASPHYLSGHPAPRAPRDLARHDCLRRIGDDVWRFRDRGEPVAVKVRGPLAADTPEPLRQAALAGLGLAMLPSFLVGGDVAAGRLISVLAPYAIPKAAIYAVYSPPKPPAAARAFIDFLVDELATTGEA